MVRPNFLGKVVALTDSRRFWAAVAAIAVTALSEFLGIDKETATQIVSVIIAWIVGDSLRTTV